MINRYCKNRKCMVILNEYNADCSCVSCDKDMNQCNMMHCADKCITSTSSVASEAQHRKCQLCMNFSRILLAQHTK